jgi:hypothetical protein
MPIFNVRGSKNIKIELYTLPLGISPHKYSQMLSEMSSLYFPQMPDSDYEKVTNQLNYTKLDLDELLWDIRMLERNRWNLSDEEEDRLVEWYSEKIKLIARIAELTIRKEVMEAQQRCPGCLGNEMNQQAHSMGGCLG